MKSLRAHILQQARSIPAYHVQHLQKIKRDRGIPAHLFTTGEAASYLNVSTGAIWNAREAGQLPGVQHGGWWCFTREALNAWEAAGYRDAWQRGRPRKARQGEN